MGIRAVVRRCDQNALVRSLIVNAAVEIAYGRYVDCICIPLGLNHDLTSSDRIGIKYHGINPAITTRARDLDLSSCRRELIREKLTDQLLEIFPIHCGEVEAFGKNIRHSIGSREPLV